MKLNDLYCFGVGMLKDEFIRVMQLFHDAAEGEKVNLEEVFQQSFQLFEHIKDQLARGTPDEKREALRMMSEMYTQMIKDSKRIAESSGMTEEQLLAFADNPSNFTPEQWNAMQASKERIRSAGEELSASLEKTEIEKKPPSQGKKHPEKKTKKSEWLRS